MAVAAAAMEAAVQSVGILDLCGTPSATLEKKERGKRKREREREREKKTQADPLNRSQEHWSHFSTLHLK